jgi:tRNA (guanine-N7-)-methyltransferase
LRSIRSFAKARSRLSTNHKKILNQESDFLFSVNSRPTFEETLRSTENKILEIGFGEGDSLFEMAANNPDLNFFGIEVYETGVARTCSKIEESGIKNLKIYLGDVVDLMLERDIETTFDLLLFLFPDPWHKRKHNKRRLLSPNNLNKFRSYLSKEGFIFFRTDWQEYADSVKKICNDQKVEFQELEKLTLLNQLILTKYQRKGIEAGRSISSFLFK